jgi:hypothetical protein
MSQYPRKSGMTIMGAWKSLICLERIIPLDGWKEWTDVDRLYESIEVVIIHIWLPQVSL